MVCEKMRANTRIIQVGFSDEMRGLFGQEAWTKIFYSSRNKEHGKNLSQWQEGWPSVERDTGRVTVLMVEVCTISLLISTISLSNRNQSH